MSEWKNDRPSDWFQKREQILERLQGEDPKWWDLIEKGFDAALAALRERGIRAKCAGNGFWCLDGTNAAWNLADRCDGESGHLIWLPEKGEDSEGSNLS